MKHKLAIIGALAFVFATQAANAQNAAPSTSIIGNTEIAEIHEWLQNPVVKISIDAQNKRYAAIKQSTIDELDKQWRTERKAEDQPLVAATLSSPLSSYLTQIQAASGGLFTEIFVMDAKGLNVGQSSITSDFWQGDEGKFQKTFPKGKDAIFIDDAEFNKDTKTWRTQVNLTIADTQGKPIGAVTVEYNLTELARRQTAQ